MIKFAHRTNWDTTIVLELAGKRWKVLYDAETLGFYLVEDDDTGNIPQDLTPEELHEEYGIEADGDVRRVAAEWTAAQAEEALRVVSEEFGLGVPKDGRLVVSGNGSVFLAGPKQVNADGHEWVESRRLEVSGRSIEVGTGGFYTTGKVCRPPDVIRMNGWGLTMAPLVPVLARIVRWGDVLVDMIHAKRRRPSGYGWKLHVDFRPDDTFHVGWRGGIA